MYIRKSKHKHADGSIWTQIQIVEGYRPDKNSSPRQRIIRDCGYLENQKDPEEFLEDLKKEVEAMNQEKSLPPLTIDKTKKINDISNRDYNYGPYLIDRIYEQLGITKMLDKIRNSKAKYSLDEIFRYLIAMRITWPDSKRGSYMDSKHIYGMKTSFTLPQIYRSLDEICKYREEIQDYLHEWIDQKLPCDKSYVYLDTTNFYFETDYPKSETALGQRGVSKEHRVSPIVQMGCVLNANGFPIAHECFQGNTADSLILKPMIKSVLKRKRLGEKIIVVADKGLNSGANIDYLINSGNGFVFSQIIRGKKGKRYHEALFDENGYTTNEAGTYKWKLFEEEYQGTDSKKNKVIRKRKVLLYWDQKNAERDRNKRKQKVLRAEKSLQNNVYSADHSKDKYIKTIAYDKETGEVLEPGKIASINQELIDEEAKFDGYSCIITSELDYDEKQIRHVYHNLWEIENSFRIEKTDLDTRPIFLQTDDHIRAHFVICHIALFIMRLLQWSMGNNSVSPERIQRVLQNCVLDIPAAGLVHLHEVSGKIEYSSYVDDSGGRMYTLKPTGKDEVTEDFNSLCNAIGFSVDLAYERLEVFTKKRNRIALTLHVS